MPATPMALLPRWWDPGNCLRPKKTRSTKANRPGLKLKPWKAPGFMGIADVQPSGQWHTSFQPGRSPVQAEHPRLQNHAGQLLVPL